MRSDFAQSVLDEIDIVELITENVTLEGNKARCPFPDHHDTAPSFVVYPNTQSFYCWGCKRGGTAIDFIMHLDGVQAGEAIRILCEWANIPLPTWTKDEKEKWEKQKSEKDIVTAILHDAFKIYHDEMDEARWDYWRGRGLTNETIKKELLGYAPDDDTFLFDRLKDKYTIDELLLSGLFVRTKNGIKDAYQRRYVIPYWHQSKIVYSIGRLELNDPNEIAQLPDWNKGKYKKHLTHNNKHSYVSKAIENVIWGADLARGFDEGIITEGIVDALLAKQAGFGVISPVTTKFANKDIEQLCKLSKHWNVVYIINDSEVSKEGEKGALQTAEAIFKNGGFSRLVTLPLPKGTDKIDLADFLNVPDDRRGNRRLELQELMDEAPDYIEWKINKAAELPDRDRPKATREIFSLLVDVEGRLELERYAELMKKTNLVSGKRLFVSALTDARIEQAKKRKQEQMKHLENEAPELFLKAQIKDVRKNKYSKAFEIKQDVSRIILDDMRECGRFYQTKTRHYYWFNDDTNQLVEMGDEVFEHYVNDRYGLNSTEAEYEYLVAELKAKAGNYGELTEVYRFSHYNLNSGNLYVDRNDCRMYRLNGDTIDLLPNGSDNILFITDDTFEPFEIIDIDQSAGGTLLGRCGGIELPSNFPKFIKPLIIEPVNFIAGEHVNLDKTQQQIVLDIWIRTLFFEELQPTKPLLTFIGEHGSGKTTIQRLIGKWLFGKEFNVQGVNEEKDFLATITHNYLASFDNVDSYKKWLCDRLSQVATGQRIEMRELYTTNQVARFYPRCFVTLNSREPKFKRPDVVDRLLLLQLEKIESKRSERVMLQEIADNRNELWTEILHDLNSIVKALKTDKEPFTTRHRMADFALLGWRIAKIENAEEYWLSILDDMEEERRDFLIKDTAIYKCIDGLLLEKNKLENKTTGELYGIFKNYAKNNEIYFEHIKNARSLGQKLSYYLSSLKKVFDIERDDEKSGYIYTITAKEGE